MQNSTLFRRAAALLLTAALALTLVLPGLAAYEMPIQTVNEGESVYLFNADIDKPILEQNADQQRYIASLTKMMTALLFLESGKDMNAEITIPASLTQEFKDIQNANGSTINLRIGETVRRIDLLYGLLVASANDAASVIASDVSDGDLTAFVARMNQRAKELGCTSTSFTCVHGLYDYGNVSSAHDLALIAKACAENETYMQVANTLSYTLPATNLHQNERTITSTNLMLNPEYPYYRDYIRGMKTGFTTDQLESAVKAMEAGGVKVMVSKGSATTILGAEGDASRIDQEKVSMLPGVDRVMRVSEPYKKANRKYHPDNTVIDLGNSATVGGDRLAVIAGPCSVESEEQICGIAESVKKSGAQFLRGGAFKPRTSPYSFQGMKAEGLELLSEAKKKTGLPIVTEIMSIEHLPLFEDVDIIQVGARNMQNFELLKQLGRLNKPILLKRGLANTIEELLMSAEYIMAGGNEQVILCERGIRTYETFTRNTLDISAVPVIKKLSHLPVIVDPSHASGINWLIEPLALAAAAIGADGLIIEVHNDPSHALCDGAQSITPAQFDALAKKVSQVSGLVRSL